MRGTGEQRQFWGTWNIGNQDYRGTKQLIAGEQGNRYLAGRASSFEHLYI